MEPRTPIGLRRGRLTGRLGASGGAFRRGRQPSKIASGDKLLATLKFLMLASDSFWGMELP